jgi:hypothetical protein
LKAGRLPGVCHKSVNDPLNKKYFVLLPVFLIFSKKIKKTGDQTLFYFAAGGSEILVIHPHLIRPDL